MDILPKIRRWFAAIAPSAIMSSAAETRTGRSVLPRRDRLATVVKATGPQSHPAMGCEDTSAAAGGERAWLSGCWLSFGPETVRLPPRSSLLSPRQNAIDHFAGLAEIVRGIAELFESGAIEVLGNLGILGEQIDQRTAGGDHLAANIVDEVVSILAAHMGAQAHHHGFGHDQAAG